jgi:hypothetical protein
MLADNAGVVSTEFFSGAYRDWFGFVSHGGHGGLAEQWQYASDLFLILFARVTSKELHREIPPLKYPP